jgi:hypothetical protein
LNPIELIWAQVKGFVAEKIQLFVWRMWKNLFMGVWQNYKGSLGEGRRPCIRNRKGVWIWPSYFNLSEIIRKRTIFSANKFTEVRHRVHNYWIWIKFYTRDNRPAAEPPSFLLLYGITSTVSWLSHLTSKLGLFWRT